MKFDIADKVILRFSEERKDSSALFRAADGEFATVVERYSQSHLPDVDFYEVELEIPVSIDGRDMVLISGLLDKELERMEPENAGKTNLKYRTQTTNYDKLGKSRKTKMNQHTKRFDQMFGEAFMEKTANRQEISKTDESVNWGADNRFTWDQEDQPNIFQKSVEYANIDVYDPPKNFPDSITALINQKYPDFERLAELGLHKGIELEGIRPESCGLTYYMKPLMGRYGINEIETVALKIGMLFSLEVFNIDKDDYEVWDELNLEIIDDTNLFMKGKVKYSIGNEFPLEFDSITINMHRSWNQADFTYEIGFGE